MRDWSRKHYCSIVNRFPYLHPDGYESYNNGWRRHQAVFGQAGFHFPQTAGRPVRWRLLLARLSQARDEAEKRPPVLAAEVVGE